MLPEGILQCCWSQGSIIPGWASGIVVLYVLLFYYVLIQVVFNTDRGADGRADGRTDGRTVTWSHQQPRLVLGRGRAERGPGGRANLGGRLAWLVVRDAKLDHARLLVLCGLHESVRAPHVVVDDAQSGSVS